MKKLFAVAIIIAVMFSVANADFGIYPSAGRVIKVDHTEDTVTFCDGAGNLWVFYGAEDWQILDIVACIFWDAGTPEIWDDEILDVTYCGTI